MAPAESIGADIESARVVRESSACAGCNQVAKRATRGLPAAGAP